MGIQIIATGSVTPAYEVSNYDLEQIMDTSDEWITKRTGIKTRYISQGENTSDLGYQAAMTALNKANIKPTDIKFIIVATMSPDFNTPSTACLIQHKIGATQAFAFDVNAACSGFIYALYLAEQLMSNQDGYGLVIGSEVMSKWLDWSDRSTAILFGDAAGCVIVKSVPKSNMLSCVLHSDGSKASALTAGHKVVSNAFGNGASHIQSCLSMQGREVFNFATRQIPQLILETLHQVNYDVNQVDYYLLHQANSRIIDIVAKKLNIPLHKIPTNLEKYGNTSAASIPLLLDELVEQRILVLGSQQKIVLAGFGGGLTWGAQLILL